MICLVLTDLKLFDSVDFPKSKIVFVSRLTLDQSAKMNNLSFVQVIQYIRGLCHLKLN